jgi:protein-S-isoprenylcysteine O-methyltransferase Ste14
MNVLHIFILMSWVVFWVYWLISALNTKRTTYNGWGTFLGIRLAILLVVLLLLRSHHIHSDFWSSVFNNHYLVTHNLPLEIIGSVIVIGGLLFAVWARLHLGKNWGTPMSHKENPELITSGPYHYVRHPIYTGILCAVLGTAIAIGTAWLVLLIISGTYFIFSAFREEKYLETKFGDSYTKYKKSSKMLIPFVL